MAKKKNKKAKDKSGPVTGEFIAPIDDQDSVIEDLPKQEEFWRPPVRFGSIPVEKEPLGWDRRKGFRKLFPSVMLPTQVVDRVEFGHPDLEPNRLFWGDNLHVMRQLPSQSIDLIYIDPPFFSGRNYNVIFGDQNELRSFSDIWEGGMPGYLIWLNARLYEMKRLLKKTGSIYVHCDWHASHYIKVEMDKIFGYNSLRNEIVWRYRRWTAASRTYQRMHDILFWYSKNKQYKFNKQYEPFSEKTSIAPYKRKVEGGRSVQDKTQLMDRDPKKGVAMHDVWNIPFIHPIAKERIGYPTQKPESLIERAIFGHTDVNDVVADFFCGGGTTPAVAQRLGRRWITCDQSRVAVAITADRITRLVEDRTGKVFPVPDFTIEHWGVYEAARLSKSPPDQFREFVLRAFGARPDDSQPGIHGTKGAVPVWVGQPNQRKGVTAKDVQDFANGVRKTVRYQQDNLRDGIMLAWAFRQDAVKAAGKLRQLENTDLNFIRLEQVRIDSPRFRENVTGLSTAHADYDNFLTFVQPPKVEVGWEKLSAHNYIFDVSDTVILNSGAKIINVQWDFSYSGHFSSTPGYSFIRTKKKEPALQAEYEFSMMGKFSIACKVQDDAGGEGMWTGKIEVI